MRRPSLARRGVTLIEVMVSLSISAVVTTIAISSVVYVNRMRLESQARGQLIADAMLVTQMFGRDMAFLGVGVPRGFRMDQPDFATAGLEEFQLRPPVRIARTDNVAFVGDLPYPNAELNGAVSLVYVKNHPSASELFLSSELSPCIPDGGTAIACDAPTRTLVPGSWTAADDCADTTAGKKARLCPMGLNKWQIVDPSQKEVVLTIAGLDGSWYSRAWKGELRSGLPPNGNFLGVVIDSGRPDGTTWKNSESGVLPSDASFLNRNGGSYVSTVDRVFWSFETTSGGAAIDGSGEVVDACNTGGCVLRRRQCWGRIVNPRDASFPGITTSALRSGSTVSECQAPREGTAWETIATGVRSFELRYFDDSGVRITAWDIDEASTVGNIELQMTLGRKVVGTDGVSTYTVHQRFYLENAGGLTMPPSKYPGCKTGSACSRPPWNKKGRCESHRCGAPGNQAVDTAQDNEVIDDDDPSGEGEGEGD